MNPIDVKFAAAFLLAASALGAPGGGDAGYTRPEACAECHRGIAESYRRTGMGRSFAQPSPLNTIEDYTKNNTYYHKASDSYFTMLRRDGKYYQLRYQIDRNGRRVNVLEKRIDYILGSGNHARTYLNRTSRGTLIELPLGWYAEKGGYWAMNPGYDRPHHDGFRRPITYECMFCHNAYPEIPAGHEQAYAEPVYTGALPEGIDCQRCHGPGGRHARLAKTAGAKPEEVRKAIVNPARLSAERQAEICMQCHLETTSFPLPNSLRRYGRGPFSYRPGEALSAFALFFDHAAGSGREEKFEIVSAAYRLRRSACFRKSGLARRGGEGSGSSPCVGPPCAGPPAAETGGISGRPPCVDTSIDAARTSACATGSGLGCTTCHNPHDIRRGAEATRRYNAVCRQCHAALAAQHPAAAECIDCHMPKRRAEDAVHVVMTDHYIQRRKPAGDLLAERAERHETEADAYRGEVVPYYPQTLPQTAENALDLAVAQVIDKSNVAAGIPRLAEAIRKYSPARAEYYFELAEAWRESGDAAKALPLLREAVRRNPRFVAGLQKLGIALRRAGRNDEAAAVLERARAIAPDNASTWRELGLTYQAEGRKREAMAALEKALALDPEMAEAHNNLGVMRSLEGERAGAAAAFREAIRIQPDYADAHGNLGNLLAGSGDLAAALEEFELALRLRPEDATTRYNYAMALGRARHFEDAQRELEAALRANPELADAQALLAELLMAQGQAAAALPHYREAVRLRPESGRAQLGLAAALLASGDARGAIPHLRKAAADADPAVREQADQALRRLAK